MRRSSRVKAEVGKGWTTGPLNVRHSIQRVPGAPDTCGHIRLHHGTGSSFTHSMNRFVEYLLCARSTQMQLLHHTAPALMGRQTRSKEDIEFETESFDGDWGQLGMWVPLARVLWGGFSKRNHLSGDLKDKAGWPWEDQGEEHPR